MWPQYRGDVHPCGGTILSRHLLRLRGVRGSHHRQVLHPGGREVGCGSEDDDDDDGLGDGGGDGFY